MIDWLTLKLPVPYYAETGKFIEVSPAGEVLMCANLPVHAVASDDTAHQSWSDRLRIWPGDRVRISGNYAKWLQGHNVDGPECPAELLRETLKEIGPLLGLTTEVDMLQVEVSRLDVTHSFVLPTSLSPYTATNLIARHGFLEKKGRGLAKGHSVSFGKATGTAKVVIYDKGKELKKHPPSLQAQAELAKYPEIERLLRVEARFTRKFMAARNLQALALWTAETCQAEWDNIMGKLHVNETTYTELHPEDPRGRLRGLVTQWKAGELPPMSTRTMFRNRAAIRRMYGVDLLTQPPEEDASNVVSWGTFLRAQNRWRMGRSVAPEGRVVTLSTGSKRAG